MKNIFITEGDPTGISYEIFDETLKYLKKKCKQFRFILVSSQNQISSKAEKEFLSINSRTSIEPALKDKASSKIISFKNTILSKKEEKESETGVSRCTALTFCGYRCTRAALPEASMCRQHLKKSMSPPKQKEVEKPVKIGTCGYIMRNGKPCGNWPMKGKMHCYTHSGV